MAEMSVDDSTTMAVDGAVVSVTVPAQVHGSALTHNDGMRRIVSDQGGTDLADVKNMSFESIRDEMVARYANSPHVNASELATCETRDQLLSVLNRRETRPIPDNDFAAAMYLRQRLEAEGKIEKIRSDVTDRYRIVDAETGEEVVADRNNQEHRNRLTEKFLKAVDVKLTTAKQASVLNDLALLNATSIMQVASLTPEEKKLPDEEKRALIERKIQTQVAFVSGAQAELNALVTAPASDIAVALRVESLEFADRARGFFPIDAKQFVFAAVQFSKHVFKAALHWNAYPTLIFESRLRLLMSGEPAHRVATSYGYNRFVHSMFMNLLGTDLCHTDHGDFLDETELLCREKQAEALKRRSEIDGLDISEEKKEEERKLVLGKLEDIAFFARSIAVARKDYQEPRAIISPYADYLQRPVNLGGAWNRSQIPRHSKPEICGIVEHALERIDRSFSEQLERIETRYRDAAPTDPNVNGRKGEFANFIRECWALNHTFSVESSRCYDLGLLLLFEQAIPLEFRYNMSAPMNVVDDSGVAAPEIVAQCAFDREFYGKCRDYCVYYVNQKIGEDEMDCKVGTTGIRFDPAEVNEIAQQPIEPHQAGAATFGEYYAFYNYVTAEYSQALALSFRADAADYLYGKLYHEDGKLDVNWRKIIEDLYKEGDVSVEQAKRVRV